MNLDKMDTPSTRSEFEHRFHKLFESIHQGKYHTAPGLDLGLDKVRFLPNGRIDFLSVNESARLQANSFSQFSKEKYPELFEQLEDSKDKDNDS